MSLGDSATQLGKVRGLGPGGEGGEHWIRERLTSIALLLLGLWLIASLLFLPELDRGTIVEWLATPLGAVPMALLVITAFIHGIDGMKVVADDYIHEEGERFAVNAVLLFVGIAGMALSLFALGRIAFGGAA
jgi:succinate dehydrogenase / fumarate reductase membrane anchor subunit